MIFNTEMVRAILEERKSATRRVALKSDELRSFPCSLYPDGWWFRGRVYASKEKAMRSVEGVMELCKYHPGDILWVRETWAKSMAGTFMYRADDKAIMVERWHPSIHMPREAARIFLRVTDVRVERLQDMRLKDCEKEGVQLNFVESADLVMGSIRARERFSGVWDSTIKPKDLAAYGWDANPWVWVIEFERISMEEAYCG